MRTVAVWTLALSLRTAVATEDVVTDAGAVEGAGRASRTNVYELQETYGTQGFFSKWDFRTDEDPSNGAVKYLSLEEARAAGMVREEADQAYFGVDMSSVVEAGAGRPSVRIQSKATYNRGLFVVKVNHAPTGCGTWPAFWMYGKDPKHPWPKWGEYDIVEGIHNMKRAMTTLHTSEQCAQDNVQAGTDFLGAWEVGTSQTHNADNCDVKAPGQWENQGCSQRTPDNSWGAPFNEAGGGTYAAEWDPDAQHIRTWFWPAGSEPQDLAERLPMPDTWGTPFSFFSLSPESCAASHFQNMRLVFTLNMCGDLGDPYFADSCPVAAAEMTCRDLVEKHPEVLKEAYWSIASLDVYQKPHGALLPFIIFDDGAPSPGAHNAVQSGFLTVLGAAAAVMGLAGVALVVRAELSRVNMRDDEESRRSIVAEDLGIPGGPRRENSGLLTQASQFVQLMFDGSRNRAAGGGVEVFQRQESAASAAERGRLRGFSWASSTAETASVAPSAAGPSRDRGISFASECEPPPSECADVPHHTSSSGTNPQWVL